MGDAIDPPISVLHLHGPGDIGKTSLLQALGVIAAGAGATVARLDGRDLEPSPVSVLEALEKTLAIPAGTVLSVCRGAVGGWCCWSMRMSK